jgi:hypothetical protein
MRRASVPARPMLSQTNTRATQQQHAHTRSMTPSRRSLRFFLAVMLVAAPVFVGGE